MFPSLSQPQLFFLIFIFLSPHSQINIATCNPIAFNCGFVSIRKEKYKIKKEEVMMREIEA